MIKRRRIPRRKLGRRIGLLYRGQFACGVAIEIGEGGMLFSCESTIPVGQKLLITFCLPGQDYSVIPAEVRYHTQTNNEKKAHGAQFLNPDFQLRRNIRRYISQKTEKESRVEIAQLKEHSNNPNHRASRLAR